MKKKIQQEEIKPIYNVGTFCMTINESDINIYDNLVVALINLNK